MTEGFCPSGSTKRERERERKSKGGGESVTEGLCVEEQPLLFFFFQVLALSVQVAGERGRRTGKEE